MKTENIYISVIFLYSFCNLNTIKDQNAIFLSELQIILAVNVNLSIFLMSHHFISKCHIYSVVWLFYLKCYNFYYLLIIFIESLNLLVDKVISNHQFSVSDFT